MLEILLDPEDAHLWPLPWYINGGYIRRTYYDQDGSHRHEFLHRAVLSVPVGHVIDHINGNTLDNRRCNLRVCTPGENAKNRGPYKNNTTRFKGVCYVARLGKFRASIGCDGIKHRLGWFDTAEAAAAAYNKAALDLHGEFARLN
jgi:hypothetical protein